MQIGTPRVHKAPFLGSAREKHVTDVVIKYMRRADVRTAYDRLFSKHVHEESLELGQQILWRKR